jgi:transcriptional regulator with XRE-family HTH domain
MNLGKAIKDVRRAVGMTQDELASSVGLTQAGISLIESNQSMPHPDNLKIIAEVLGVSVGLLYVYGLEKGDCPKGKYNEAIMESIRFLALKLVTL